MEALPIILLIFVLSYLVFRRSEKSSEYGVRKLSKGVYLTDSGIVDFNKEAELTPSQKAHNKLLDLKIEAARKYNEEEDRIHRKRMKEWTEYREKALKENPDQMIMAWYPCMNLERKYVHGIRYMA